MHQLDGYCWDNLGLKHHLYFPSFTLVFMSAFWMTYPVISELPSSLGGSHSSAALKPQTSVTLTFRGGPGFSEQNERQMFKQRYISQSAFLIMFY